MAYPVGLHGAEPMDLYRADDGVYIVVGYQASPTVILHRVLNEEGRPVVGPAPAAPCRELPQRAAVHAYRLNAQRTGNQVMDREFLAKEALYDGKDARRAGQPIDANPHRPGTREFSAWDEGWNFEDRFILRSAA